MKEVKFRAWDNKLKKMSYRVNVYTESKDDSWWSADHINPEDDNHTMSSFDNNTGDLEQYTGRNDEDYENIYEGDLVKVTDFSERGDGTREDAVMAVEWSEDNAEWILVSRDKSIIELLNMEEVLVIGTIHDDEGTV